MDNKIQELEIKVAYLEDYINELNKIVINHDVKIDKLILINKQLRERVGFLEENQKETRENIPPPHY